MITWSPTNLPGVREYRSGGRVYYLTIAVYCAIIEVAEAATGERLTWMYHEREGDTDEDLILEAERLLKGQAVSNARGEWTEDI